MKTKTILFLLAISTATAISVQAQNYETLNPILQAIAAQTLPNDDQLEYTYPHFDTKLSSIQNERLVYTVDAKLKNTPWLANGKATAEAITDYRVDRSTPLTKVIVNVGAKMKMDAIPFLRYAGGVALKKIRGYEPNYETRIKSLLQKITQINSIEEFYSILQDGQTLALDQIDFKIKKQWDYIDCLYRLECGNVKIDEWGNRVADPVAVMGAQSLIDYLMAQRGSALANQITMKDGSVHIANFFPSGFTNGSKAKGYAKAIDFAMNNNGFITTGVIAVDVKGKELDELKTELTDSFNKLIANDADKAKETQDLFRTFLKGFKNVLNGRLNGSDS